MIVEIHGLSAATTKPVANAPATAVDMKALALSGRLDIQ
jgi:hypothetical protein